MVARNVRKKIDLKLHY